MSHDITYMWNLKYDINELIYETETDSQTENRLVVAKGDEGQGRDGVWGQQMQTVMYRMDKQQGPTVQHKELYSVSCDKP